MTQPVLRTLRKHPTISRLLPIKSHLIHSVEQVLIAYREIQALQGFLLIPMP